MLSTARYVWLALIELRSDVYSYRHGATMHTSKHKTLELRIRQVGPWSLNAYALICPQTRESLLIDPGDDPAALTEMLTGTRPSSILVTHGHPDHIGALDAMRGKLDVPVLSHGGDGNGPVVADRWLADGDQLAIGRGTLRVHHTPGHTADHLCFAIEGDCRILVGDCLFEGGPGKTWSPQDFRTTLQTLQDIILGWPDEAVCYPGHGRSFRLGAIRPAIERFLAKAHGPFHGDAEWGM